jgi:hypothetical protein
MDEMYGYEMRRDEEDIHDMEFCFMLYALLARGVGDQRVQNQRSDLDCAR